VENSWPFCFSCAIAVVPIDRVRTLLKDKQTRAQLLCSLIATWTLRSRPGQIDFCLVCLVHAGQPGPISTITACARSLASPPTQVAMRVIDRWLDQTPEKYSSSRHGCGTRPPWLTARKVLRAQCRARRRPSSRRRASAGICGGRSWARRAAHRSGVVNGSSTHSIAPANDPPDRFEHCRP